MNLILNAFHYTIFDIEEQYIYWPLAIYHLYHLTLLL